MAGRLGALSPLLLAAAVVGGCRAGALPRPEAPAGMRLLPGGTFVMGSDTGLPHEAPAHAVEVRSFWIDTHEVTVAEFARFVAATGYRTEAERFGWSGAFDPTARAWRKVDGADWTHPDGPASAASGDEPVTQVSWNDADAYARWAGKRLPTEAEWEYAARGGLEGRAYAWGDELRPGGRLLANWWQGRFPDHDTGEDGYLARARVGRFPANGHGLHDMIGNVWEWCADWYDSAYYARSPRRDPRGPASGRSRVLRGGSWLCSENFCSNYRVAGRSEATPESGLNNLGFRCARDPRDGRRSSDREAAPEAVETGWPSRRPALATELPFLRTGPVEVRGPASGRNLAEEP